MVNKPEDVSQEAWHAAMVAIEQAGPEMGAIWGYELGAKFVARAIMAAKAEEREQIAKMAEAHGAKYNDMGWAALRVFASDIRSRT